MICGTSLHYWAVILAVAGACLGLIGGFTMLIWRPVATQRIIIAFRAAQSESQSGSRWSASILWGVGAALVMMAAFSALDPPNVVYVLWFGTLLPLGVIDMAQNQHCKAVATGQQIDQEWSTVNRVAQQSAPVLIPAGIVLALVATVVAVVSTVC